LSAVECCSRDARSDEQQNHVFHAADWAPVESAVQRWIDARHSEAKG
jgi:hypothetical protein